MSLKVGILFFLFAMICCGLSLPNADPVFRRMNFAGIMNQPLEEKDLNALFGSKIDFSEPQRKFYNRVSFEIRIEIITVEISDVLSHALQKV